MKQALNTVYVTFTRRVVVIETQTVELDVPVLGADETLQSDARAGLVAEDWRQQKVDTIHEPVVDVVEICDAYIPGVTHTRGVW